MVGCRSGYLAWMVVGLTMCGLCWRRRLLAMVTVALVLFLTLQGVSSRLTTGFGETDVAGQKTVNYYEVTSGRNLIWPYVLDRIADAPNFGYGRDAMRRTGLTAALEASAGKSEAVGHAHNAYLELLLESGVVGLVVVMAFYGAVGLRALRLFREPNCPACAGAGGVALATIVGYLVTGLGSQHFYPQEGDIGMWCAIGLALRVACDSRHGTVHPSRQRHQTRSI
jgi:O-antigen ligase